MRRLCLTLLCGLIVVPAALAAADATGDGVLEIKDAAGIVVLNTTRGTVWGQMERGTLLVSDPLAGDGVILVNGAGTGIPVADNVTQYRGRDLHFRVTGGKARLWFKGSGLNLTAVGVGRVQFTGDALGPGEFALDSGKWNPVPVDTSTFRFGVQPTPAPAP
jgi:hypothetical protein